MWSVLLALYFRSSCVSWKSLPIKQCWSCCCWCWCCCCCFLLLFLLVVVVLVVLWPFESHRLESTKHFFNKKSTFWLSSKSSQSLHLLGQLFLCIHVDHHWNFRQKITVARILGHGEEPPELLRPFSGVGKIIKVHQIGQNPHIVAKKLDFPSFFFRFVFVSAFFFDWFRFCFRFLPIFSVFESNLTKSKNAKKHLFFSFLSMYFRFFSFVFVFSFVFLNYFRTEKTFSNYFRIAKTLFTSFSNYFRIKGEFLNCLRTWNAHMDCIFTITGAIAQWSWRPWQDLLRQAITVVLCEHSVTMEN